MSSVGKLEREIHEIYTDAYRHFRLYRNGLTADPVPNQFRPLYRYWPYLQKALISVDNRHAEFDGWINPFRRHHFRSHAPYQAAWYGIPF